MYCTCLQMKQRIGANALASRDSISQAVETLMSRQDDVMALLHARAPTKVTHECGTQMSPDRSYLRSSLQPASEAKRIVADVATQASDRGRKRCSPQVSNADLVPTGLPALSIAAHSLRDHRSGVAVHAGSMKVVQCADPFSQSSLPLSQSEKRPVEHCQVKQLRSMYCTLNGPMRPGR
jgi:hypothetical protein